MAIISTPSKFSRAFWNIMREKLRPGYRFFPGNYINKTYLGEKKQDRWPELECLSRLTLEQKYAWDYTRRSIYRYPTNMTGIFYCTEKTTFYFKSSTRLPSMSIRLIKTINAIPVTMREPSLSFQRKFHQLLRKEFMIISGVSIHGSSCAVNAFFKRFLQIYIPIACCK